MTATGALIKSARLNAGLSQGKLARKLGYETPQYISNIERGLCSLNLRKAKKLCKATGMNPLELRYALRADFQKFLKSFGL